MRALPLLLAAVVAAGCGATQEARRSSLKPASGFLSDYSQLKPVKEGKAELLYLDESAPWSVYHGVFIEPVTFWGDENSLPPAVRAMLCDYAFDSLQKHLGKKFELAKKTGPGVLRLRAAITDAKAATPLLRSVSMVAPSARVAATVKDLAVGSYPFAGSAQGEAEITDSVSGRRLAAFVDKKIGGGSVASVAVWKWGDVKNIIDDWSERLLARLLLLGAAPAH